MEETKTEEPKRVRFMCCMQTMPFEIVIDNEGYIVCPVHKERRYGWRSTRKKAYKASPFDPENPQYIFRPDYTKSLLEHDQDFVRELLGPVEKDINADK